MDEISKAKGIPCSYSLDREIMLYAARIAFEVYEYSGFSMTLEA